MKILSSSLKLHNFVLMICILIINFSNIVKYMQFKLSNQMLTKRRGFLNAYCSLIVAFLISFSLFICPINVVINTFDKINDDRDYCCLFF